MGHACLIYVVVPDADSYLPIALLVSREVSFEQGRAL